MGAGIYARRELAPGELLWEETAVIETDAPMTDAAARTIQTQYAALPTDKKAQVDTLYDRNRLDGARKPGDPSDINILSIFDTNSTQWNTAAALIGPGDEGSGKVPKDVEKQNKHWPDPPFFLSRLLRTTTAGRLCRGTSFLLPCPTAGSSSRGPALCGTATMSIQSIGQNIECPGTSKLNTMLMLS